jgi:hypothetical protein
LLYAQGTLILFICTASNRVPTPQKNWDAAIADCSTALTKSPNYLKAFMRRAQAFEALDASTQQALDPADQFNTEKYSTATLEDAVKGMLVSCHFSQPLTTVFGTCRS